jgi:pescadillo protein
VNKSSTASTTFYYTKDIQYLLHEPLLAKFRDQKALAKKISKALGRNDVGDAARFEKNLTPKLKLDHIIKERYPTFVDALRDLDDALSMLFLFANLPGNQNVPPKMIARCQRLTMEFEHFLIRTHAMRKSFLSIKGIYYQATIQGQDILWLVPYKFVQQAGPDVDFRIMATFVEFYATLLSFVNYRLYSSIGLVYPPRFDLKSLEQGAELGAFQLEGQRLEEQAEADAIMDTGANEKAQAEADKLLTNGEAEPQSSYATAPETSVVEADNEPTETPLAALDKFASIDPNADALLQPSLTADAQVAGKLFEPFTIFLSRETPRHALEFLLRSFGCRRVGWSATLGEGAYCDESDPRITHQIVDRPDIPIPAPEDDDEDAQAARKANARVPGRIYVQPQWVWDSVNAGQLQRPDIYAPGATLPPHLSPWVRAKKGEYDPTKPLAEQELEGEAEAAAAAEEDEVSDDDVEQSDDEEVTKADLADLADIEQGEGMDVELAGSDSEAEGAAASDDEFGGFSGDEDEQEPTTEADAHQAELLAEAKGLKVAPAKAPTAKEKVAAAKDKRTKAQREEDEKLEMRKMMAPRRKRKMYEKMVYSNNEKAGVAENLREKKRKIEKAAAKKASK